MANIQFSHHIFHKWTSYNRLSNTWIVFKVTLFISIKWHLLWRYCEIFLVQYCFNLMAKWKGMVEGWFPRHTSRIFRNTITKKTASGYFTFNWKSRKYWMCPLLHQYLSIFDICLPSINWITHAFALSTWIHSTKCSLLCYKFGTMNKNAQLFA